MRIVFIVLCSMFSVICLSSLSGCSLIKTKVDMQSQVTVDGETTRREFHFEGTLDELPAALEQAFEVLSQTTGDLTAALKKVTDVPPPGQITLSALSPSLKRYEGVPGVDFLGADEAGASQQAAERFHYVRIGVPSYDRFFEASMKFYATAWQVRQSVHRARELSSVVLAEDVDEGAAIREVVARALKVPTDATNKPLKGKLAQLAATIDVVRELAVSLAGQTQGLIAAGQQLVANAPSSITHPKVALHLDTIVTGLEQSVTVVTEAGGLLGETLGAALAAR